MSTRRSYRRRLGRVTVRVLFYVTLIVVLVPILLPYGQMLITSVKSPLENLKFPPSLVFEPTLRNYTVLLEKTDIPGAVLNSLIVGFTSTFVGLLIGIPAAFAIARYRLTSVGTLVLVARMIPAIALLVPWYLMFIQLQLVGSYAALFLSHLTLTVPLVVWLSVGFFEELPSELMDAAAVDGCTPLQALIRIALPLSRAGVAAAGILAFVSSWNNFLYALILGGRLELAPVATYGQVQELNQDWGVLAAAAIVTTWPIILLSLPFTRSLVKGLTAGAVRG